MDNSMMSAFSDEMEKIAISVRKATQVAYSVAKRRARTGAVGRAKNDKSWLKNFRRDNGSKLMNAEASEKRRAVRDAITSGSSRGSHGIHEPGFEHGATRWSKRDTLARMKKRRPSSFREISRG